MRFRLFRRRQLTNDDQRRWPRESLSVLSAHLARLFIRHTIHLTHHSHSVASTASCGRPANPLCVRTFARTFTPPNPLVRSLPCSSLAQPYDGLVVTFKPSPSRRTRGRNYRQTAVAPELDHQDWHGHPRQRPPSDSHLTRALRVQRGDCHCCWVPYSLYLYRKGASFCPWFSYSLSRLYAYP